MPQKAHTPPTRFIVSASRWLCLGGLALLLSACASREEVAQKRLENTPNYRPTNTFSVPSLPAEVRRVAILPVHTDRYTQKTRNLVGRQAATALTSTNRFESIPVSERDLSIMYGRSTLTATDVLPHDFFEQLQSRYAADAVLFTQLTHFDPYDPISLGVRMTLFSSETGEPLWAFDDILNAGDPRVASGAMAYERLRSYQTYPLGSATTVLKSPTEFSSYVFATAFSTLPARATTLDTLTVTRSTARNPNTVPHPEDDEASSQPAVPDFN